MSRIGDWLYERDGHGDFDRVSRVGLVVAPLIVVPVLLGLLLVLGSGDARADTLDPVPPVVDATPDPSATDPAPVDESVDQPAEVPEAATEDLAALVDQITLLVAALQYQIDNPPPAPEPVEASAAVVSLDGDQLQLIVLALGLILVCSGIQTITGIRGVSRG